MTAAEHDCIAAELDPHTDPPGESDVPATPAPSTLVDIGYTGDGTWPVAPGCVQAYAGSDCGLACIAGRMRWQNRAALVAHGGGRTIPTDMKLSHRLACHERHPGVCWSRDSGMYADVLALASAIERWVISNHAAESFLKLSTPALLGITPMIVYVASTRARRMFAPQVLTGSHPSTNTTTTSTLSS